MLSRGGRVLGDIRRAFEDEDALWLRKIGNRLAEEAALEQDARKARLSVIAYALSKILSKPHFFQSPRWHTYRKRISALLRSAEKKGDEHVLEDIEGVIADLDRQDGLFVKNIIEKARAKMAMRAYALGISLTLAAELFGTTKEELASYIGQTKIHDDRVPRIGIKERLDALRRIVHAGGE